MDLAKIRLTDRRDEALRLIHLARALLTSEQTEIAAIYLDQAAEALVNSPVDETSQYG